MEFTRIAAQRLSDTPAGSFVVIAGGGRGLVITIAFGAVERLKGVLLLPEEASHFPEPFTFKHQQDEIVIVESIQLFLDVEWLSPQADLTPNSSRDNHGSAILASGKFYLRCNLLGFDSPPRYIQLDDGEQAGRIPDRGEFLVFRSWKLYRTEHDIELKRSPLAQRSAQA